MQRVYNSLERVKFTNKDAWTLETYCLTSSFSNNVASVQIANRTVKLWAVTEMVDFS